MPFETIKMVTLSTGHVTPKTAALLDREAENGRLGLPVYPKAAGRETFGWFVYGLPDADLSGLPADLAACLSLARSIGCAVLCLDRDGPVTDRLPTYHWPK